MLPSSLRNKGFTLIELVIVVLIIGILAGLAIPRFTESASKARMAEAPRILASYESAQLAHFAEDGMYGVMSALILDVAAISDGSKWWDYAAAVSTDKLTATAFANAAVVMGKFPKGAGVRTTLDASGQISRTADPAAVTAAQAYIPAFFVR